jgi:hypothetical protein
MRWRWPWQRDRNGAGRIRAEKEAEARATKGRTPMYEKLADRVADLPPEEFAERVARAFRRRPA